MVDANRKPKAKRAVVLREEFDDWAVLFDPDSAQAVGINPVGVTIWKSMDGTRSLEDIARALPERFDDVPGSALEQVRAFVDELERRGLVALEAPEQDS